MGGLLLAFRFLVFFSMSPLLIHRLAPCFLGVCSSFQSHVISICLFEKHKTQVLDRVGFQADTRTMQFSASCFCSTSSADVMRYFMMAFGKQCKI
jgi:hypothetical protein